MNSDQENQVSHFEERAQIGDSSKQNEDSSEMCQLRCVWKTNSEVNSVRKHNYNCMLDDGIY